MKYLLTILFVLTLYSNFVVASSINAENSNIDLIYFYKPGCLKCIRIKNHLKVLHEKFPSLNIKEYNIKDTDSLELAVFFIDKLSIPEKDYFKTPMIILGNNYYLYNNFNVNKIGNDIASMKDNLNQSEHIAVSRRSTEIEQNSLDFQKQKYLLNNFNSFSLITIILAGLIDGVNPCAFALLIFFLSYLKIAKRTIEQLIIVGVVYTFVVFLTYFLIGLGFFHALKSLVVQYQFIAYALYFISAIIALIFAVLSFWDIWLIHNGHYKRIKIQLSTRTKEKIQKLIRINSRGFQIKSNQSGFRKFINKFGIKFKKFKKFKKFNSGNKMFGIIIGAVIIAVGVSFLELGCTGQIYLPVLSYILQQEVINYTAVLLLLIYNFAFIIPLIIIFIIFILGVGHDKFLRFFQRNVIIIKIITGLLFLGLSLVILMKLFW